MDSLPLLHGIFPSQGSNTGLLHCRRNLYRLSREGSPRIPELIPSPADLPNPGIELGPPALQADSLPTELSGKPSFSAEAFAMAVPVSHVFGGAKENRILQGSAQCLGSRHQYNLSNIGAPLPSAKVQVPHVVWADFHLSMATWHP